ncbi:MAG TPA: carotenoid oxygenase family protein [Thermoanaerobaculia bacterium]|nr:carotenoid oxygenase family protein [Thermoanaerobaculia bacterium]
MTIVPPGTGDRAAPERATTVEGRTGRTPAEPAADLAPALERLFAAPPPEASYRIAGIEGELPPYLAGGTYYANGPARFGRGEVSYAHWLDGDGMVARLGFDEAGATFANRFVATEKLREEEAAGRALFRTFGTAFPGDRLLRGMALASPGNVSVYPWAGRLLAFGEQGLPWELDPETLETRGVHTFGGRLNAVSPFSAHPVFDRESGEMVNFGVSFSSRRPVLNVYRFGADGDLVYRTRVGLDAPRSVHDFALSPRWAAFYLSPYVLDAERFLGGCTSLLECLVWRPELGSLLLVVDRETGAEAARVPLGERYCLHLVNAFEDDAGRLVIDVVELEEPVYPDYTPLADLFAEVAPGRPVRRVVDVAAGRVVEERALDHACACDFPHTAQADSMRPYDDFWMLAIGHTGRPGRKFLDRLVHARWSAGCDDCWQAPPGVYLGGEPVHVGAPDDPRGGVVIVQELEPAKGRGAYVLFDARQVTRGPIARLPLVHPIPPLFHACWDGADAEGSG